MYSEKGTVALPMTHGHTLGSATAPPPFRSLLHGAWRTVQVEPGLLGQPDEVFSLFI